MYRVFLSYFANYRAPLAITLVALVLLGVMWIDQPWVFAIAAPVVVGVVVFKSGLLQLLWRFRRLTSGFRTISTSNLVLHYAPAAEAWDVRKYLDTAEATLTDFTKRFGLSLRRRLVVFLFANPSELSRVFRWEYSAAALIHGDAILLSPSSRAPEMIRHELAHLFSAYWGSLDPPFKGDGLATHLEEHIDGRPVDFAALARLVGRRAMPLIALLRRSYFYYDRNYSYSLAGSFTGFLIRRFGWDAYEQFFRRCRPRRYKEDLEKVFGITFASAERQWRLELMQRRGDFEPDITTAILEQRAHAAYESYQLFQCLEDCSQLIDDGKADYATWWLVGFGHMLLGDYARAATSFEQLLARNDPEMRSSKGEVWLHLGRAYDLTGDRARAVSAYEQALREPDCWYLSRQSSHSLAKRHQRRPFTEEQLHHEVNQAWQQGRGRRSR